MKYFNTQCKLRTYFFVAALCCFFLVLNFADTASAEEGLMIVPPLIENDIKQGTSYSGEIEISNPTDELVEIYPSVKDFESNNEDGSPTFDFSTDQNTESSHSLSSWISYSNQKIALTPNQYQIFNFTVNVPMDAEPGGHYGAIFFSSNPDGPSGMASEVAQISKIGSLLLITVPGGVLEKLQIKEFSTSSNYWQLPQNFTTRLENFGNVHVKPVGNIVIKNIFGQEVVSLPFNSNSGNVLPQSIRKFSNIWPGNYWQVGRYTAELSIAYGNQNQVLIKSLNFWVIPWWMVLTLATIIILLLIILKKRKKYNYRFKTP